MAHAPRMSRGRIGRGRVDVAVRHPFVTSPVPQWPMDLRILLGIALGLAVVWAAFILLSSFLRPKDVPIGEVVRVVPDVVRMLRAIGGDHASPLDVRLALVGLLVWLVSPIDLIPELIPVLGPMDDAVDAVVAVVAVVALRYVRRRVGVAGMRARWRGTGDGFALLGRVVGFAASE